MVASVLLYLSLIQSAPIPELRIYTYDSLLSKDGFLKKVIPAFEARFKCRVRAWASGDGGQMMTRVEIDHQTKKESADVVVGVDQNLWNRIKPFSTDWKKWRPTDFEKVWSHNRVEAGFLPIDYGFFAWIIDREEAARLKIEIPKSLQDFLKPEFKRRLLLEDPRTSTPGLAFLFFTESVYKEKIWGFWKKLRTQWLTLSLGWDAAYGLFLKSEAPLVWSYTTSQAYHRMHGDPGRYEAISLQEGAPVQIEGAVMIKESPLAKEFMNFLISKDAQMNIPTTQWMYPARTDVELPPDFKKIPVPKKYQLSFPSAGEVKAILKGWGESILEKQ